MPFSSLVGNERIKKLLRRAVQENRIGQGLILAGPRGVGKYRFALALAQALNCERPSVGDACGECLSCRRIAAGEHSDVQTFSPDGQFIKIGQMRGMSRESQFRPFEGRRRVSIIDEAHRLREEAANSILKTLEEPPPSSLIVLITSRPYALIETIRSRCQMLSFAPLSAAELETYLKANFKRPPEEMRMLARLAQGSIGRALEIDLGEHRDKRAALIELIEAVWIKRDVVRLMNAAEFLGRKLDKDQFEAHMQVLLTLLADLFHLKLGAGADSLTNADIADRLASIARAVTLDQIMDWAEKIEELLQGLLRNINRHIALEGMFLTL
ncbi:MAG TPA: DNA polymerase III subunit delta' [Blastocatellia bacterium]|nr:DNA polymerase III subunit delta' [Blastocatellia bacterium]